jgi:antitoxin component HigA of HigAB toxin-antitoxin module
MKEFDLGAAFTNYNLAVRSVMRFFDSIPFTKFTDHMKFDVLETLQSALEIVYDHMESPS